MDSVEFHEPVYVGDVLSFFTETMRVGRTSVRVKVRVEAQRFERPCECVPVTVAEIVYVAIDEDRKPSPIGKSSPG